MTTIARLQTVAPTQKCPLEKVNYESAENHTSCEGEKEKPMTATTALSS